MTAISFSSVQFFFHNGYKTAEEHRANRVHDSVNCIPDVSTRVNSKTASTKGWRDQVALLSSRGAIKFNY